jgi:hypothetical protein
MSAIAESFHAVLRDAATESRDDAIFTTGICREPRVEII